LNSITFAISSSLFNHYSGDIMNYILLVLILFVGCSREPSPPPPSTPSVTQEQQVPAVQTAPTADAMLARFTKYQIAIVRKGPAWTNDAPQKIEKLTAQRGDYWKSMVDQGKLLGVARVVDPGDIRGVLFFKVQDKDEMNGVAAKAPAVQAKLLKVDVRTVWGSTGLGASLKDSAGAMQSMGKDTYYLVAMTKGAKWSSKADSPETRKATSESMEYLFGLYKEGSLRYFAALEDMNLKLRNISILKTASAEEAMKMMKESPLVKNGWLEPNVFQVQVPTGIIP
jgi:muconolactone delta-isomerase